MRSWVAVLAAVICSLSAVARAQDLGSTRQPVHVRSDSLEYERERNVWVARGNVVIDQPTRRLTADWVSFNPETRQGVASGNVVVTEGEDSVVAGFVYFDVDSLEGILFDGELDSATSGFRLRGEEVRKTGELTYVFRNGSFTTCRCEDEREPWTIEADEADLEVRGYGTARNTTIEVLGVPVVWMPWMIFPLMTDRQSGVLFPEFGASDRSGGDIGLPVFWAARHNVNVIFTPRYLFKRGYKQDVAVEYVFGERSWGELKGGVLPNDNEAGEEEAAESLNEFRWGFQWKHDQWLSEDWHFKVDAVATSDNLYSFDFNDLREVRNDRFLESVAFLGGELVESGPLAGLGAVASLWWANDQQNPDSDDRDEFLLQRLPELEVDLPSRPLSLFGVDVAPSFDVQLTNFWSRRNVADVYPGVSILGDSLFADSGVDAVPNGWERLANGQRVPQPIPPNPDVNRDDFDSITNRGGTELDELFTEGEPIADDGQKLVLNPRLAMPFDLLGGRVEIYPEAGYLGTFYDASKGGSADRQAFTGQLMAATRLRRSLGLPFGQGEAVHLLEPRLAWTYLSRSSQKDNPLFVPEGLVPQDRLRQLELFNVTRDYADRLPRANAITLAFDNKVYTPDAAGFGRLYADFTLSSQYSFVEDAFEPVYLDGAVYPAPGWRNRFSVGFDIDESRLSEGYFELGWSSPKGHDLLVGYRYVRNIPPFFESFRTSNDRFDDFDSSLTRVNQLSASARWAVTPRWGIIYHGSYSFDGDITLSNAAGVEYLSRCRCWAIAVEVDDERGRGVDVSLRYRLVGLGKDEDPVRPFAGGRRGSQLDSAGSL